MAGKDLRTRIKAEIASLAGPVAEPSLVSILVGDEPTCGTMRRHAQVGIKFRDLELPGTIKVTSRELSMD